MQLWNKVVGPCGIPALFLNLHLLQAREKNRCALRLIIFDCDGTLIDSQNTIVVSMTTAFKALGYEAPDPRKIRELIGLSLEETIRNLLPNPNLIKVDHLVTAYKKHFFEHHVTEKGSLDPLFPQAEKVLRTLYSEGYQLGIATGKSKRGLEAILEGHKLRDLFITVQTADQHPGKPHPSMLLQAMAETGMEAFHTLMLGDTSFDMTMAVNAGVHPIGVIWGYHSEDDLRAAGAYAVLGDYRELMPCLEWLWPEV